MSDWLIYCIGFFAQILFSSRLIIQWVTSEKQKKVVTPVLFWVLSLIASFMLFFYGYLRDDFAIMLGQTLTYFIYIRNLQLQHQWEKLSPFFQWVFYLIPSLIIIYYYNNNIIDSANLFKNDKIPFWLLMLGIVSQIVFTLRFIFQWLYSEKHNKSSLPFGFWLLSIIGSILILTYAVIRKDPVLLAGHAIGVVIYSRNLMLLKKHDD